VWNTQRRKLPARFFHTKGDIQMPHTFVILLTYHFRYEKGEDKEFKEEEYLPGK
jgi:hypothetical protein